MGNNDLKENVTEFENDGHRRWFRISGTDYGTGMKFDGEAYGLTEGGTILGADGCPLTEGDVEEIAVRNMLGI